MMLDRALLYRNAFNQMKAYESNFKSCPEIQEWEMVEQIRDVLEPFYDITNLFSGNDYPTSNLYFENVWKIGMLVKELVQSNDFTIQVMAEEMKKKFDKYWDHEDENDYTMLLAFAAVLDPRHKLSYIKYCYTKLFGNEDEAVVKVNKIEQNLGMLLVEYELGVDITSCQTSQTPNNTSLNISRKRKSRYDFLADYDNEQALLANNTKTKLQTYLHDPKEAQNADFDILDFWKRNESRYGKLCYLARDILSVPLTTVASESTFSIGGRVLNKWRSSYLPENVEALITARSWLYGYEENMEDEFFGVDVDWNASTSI